MVRVPVRASQLSPTPPYLTPLHVDEALRQLVATHLFSDVPRAALVELAGACTPVTLAPGEVLLREGEPGDTLYAVCAGCLRVTQRGEGGGDVLLGEVRKGEHVGEAALLASTPRTATVTAVAASRLIALSRDVLDGFLDDHPAVREALRATLDYRLQRSAARRRLRPGPAEIVAALAQFLDGVDRGVLEVLAGEVEWVTLPRGAVLLRQGEPGDCLYIVVAGRVEVYGVRDDGSKLAIGESGPGESIGEMALLSSESRAATVATLRDCEFLRLSKGGFDRLLAEHPRTMARFARIIVDRLQQRIRARAQVTQLRATPLATVEECGDVARTENLVVRNLRITQMYHRLSLELALLHGHQDANWCTFACNASKTAGYSIRREELPLYDVVHLLRKSARVDRIWAALESRVSGGALTQRFGAILDAVSDSISRGNLKVFAELGPVFAGFTRTFHAHGDHDRDALAGFLAALAPGPTETGGQDGLAEALTHYYDAIFEPHAKKKAELILLGNIKIGLHEQIRLQPYIVEALDAPLRVGLGGLLSRGVMAPVERLLPSTVAERARRRADRAERRLVEGLARVWRRLVTRSLMTLRLPYGSVRLGADVPRLARNRIHPDMLQQLEQPELVRLVRRFDSDEDSLAMSRASDWGILADRMNFIVNLFRSRQKNLELFDQPFLMEQRDALALGRVPEGRL